MRTGTHKTTIVTGGVVMSLTGWLRGIDLTHKEYKRMIARGMSQQQIEAYCATHTREERRMAQYGQKVNGVMMTPAMMAEALHMNVKKIYTYLSNHAHNYQAAWDFFEAIPEEDRNKKRSIKDDMTDEERAEKFAKRFGMVAQRKSREKMHNVHGSEMSVPMIARHFGVDVSVINKRRRRGMSVEEVFDYYHKKKLSERGITALRSTEKIVERIMRVI